MTKLFVKKPFLTLVTIVVVLTIGIVSLTKMKTDLLPEMELPYLGIIVTYPGASAAEVERDVLTTIESAVATINGAKQVQSMCFDNYGIVFIEFAEDTNMDATLVRVSQKLNTLDLPDMCGTPNLMEVSMDLMATMYVDINCEGMNIEELTSFVDSDIKPYIEKQSGVASVTVLGGVSDYVEVRLNQDKIDTLQNNIMATMMKAMIEKAIAELPDEQKMMLASMSDEEKMAFMKQMMSASASDNAAAPSTSDMDMSALFNMNTLSGLIMAQNFSMPAGYIVDENARQWLVEAGDSYKSVDEIENFVLTSIDGYGDIKLSDVADITVLNDAGKTYSKLSGEDAIMLAIYKNSTASTGAVTDTVSDALEELEDKYEGFTYATVMNQGDYIDRIINSVLSSIILGALLAIVVLALFLKDVRPTLVVAFSIPFSVFFAIVIMYFTGININVMSLAGLCLGIGMLVDNSIVVMENIYRLRNQGYTPAKAAVYGTKQVAGPIFASTITTICVFLPMVYTSGMVSQLLVPFAFTMSYSLIASLLVALTVVPTLGSVTLNKTKEAKEGIFGKIKNAYGKSLQFCLKHKYVPLLIAIALLVLCIIRVANTGLAMMDDMESSQITATMTMKEDTDPETAIKIADEAMEKILAVDGVDMVSMTDGGGSAIASNFGMSVEGDFSSFSVYVIADDKVKTTEQVKKLIKDIEAAVADIDCEEFEIGSSAMSGSMLNSGIQVNIKGDDEQTLIDISEDVMKMMAEIEGTEEITNGLEDAGKKLHLTFDKDKTISCGLTVAQVYQQLAASMKTSADAITMNVGNKDMSVTIIDTRNVITYENILDTPITATDMATGEAKVYKLSDFATIEERDSMDMIRRSNQVRYLSVSATVSEGYNATLLSRKLEKKLADYKAPAGYTVEIRGESEQVMEMVEQMVLAILLGLLLVYLVMVAQFQSLLSPFIIIFTVPLAFTGGMIGLMIFGMNITAMSLMGFMILMGTVVNNGIVFVDFANQIRIKGVEKDKALVVTGKTRMRPIIMTALTTILSMSVMVFSRDAGNSMQRGMAIVVSFGLLYSTFMTLYIVPVLYDIMYRKAPKVIDVEGEIENIEDETEELLRKSGF